VTKDFLTVLRTGKPANWGSLKDEKAWAKAMENAGFAEQFTAAMDCRGLYLGRAVARALDCANYSRLLDIAGGSGIYACCIVAAHPQMTATVLERPPVDRIAEKIISDRGYASRVSVCSGDFFAQPLPDGHDVHLFSNVLHDWDEPAVEQLLARSFQALLPGGMLAVHDAHLNARKTGPLHVAEYSAMLMHSTEGKCYSVAEMESYLKEAGFREIRFIPTAASRSIITAKKPHS
jgi:predicted O-methyltransferase YrrM